MTIGKIASDSGKESRDKKLAAETQRYSPWTGLQAQPVHYADPAGSAMQGFGSGVAMHQGMQNAEMDQKLKDAQVGWMNRGGSPQPFTGMSSANQSPWSLGDYNLSKG